MIYNFVKDENDNIIYGDIDKQLNSKIVFQGKNNIVFFAGKSKNISIECRSNNALIFIGDNVILNGWGIIIFSNSVCYIGNNTDFGASAIWISECKNFIIGNDCMLSWNLFFRNTDQHMIYSIDSRERLNNGESVYIGDHVWGGYETSYLKGCFIASGSVIGNRSVVTKKTYYSNSVYAGSPCKEVKNKIFWTRITPDFIGVSDQFLEQHSRYNSDDFVFTFEKDNFLDPKFIDRSLNALNNPYEKLIFVYNFIYMNKNKNRFAFFKDSKVDEIKNYKYENFFEKLIFAENKIDKNNHLANNLIGAKERIYNQLSYKLGKSMIENSKNLKGIIKMPFVLLKVARVHKREQEIYNTMIKLDSNLTLPKLEDYADYEEALKIKSHLSYQLGQCLIEANKYGGGYLKLPFRIYCLIKKFKTRK
ncbi:TPA: hypothetical protein RTH08_000366 [Campylobacter jejuni]|nr:hypothetical protein [Campylobacter jejuni]HDZ5096601.1 hypothetical protein [Campylobacter jejuni]